MEPEKLKKFLPYLPGALKALGGLSVIYAIWLVLGLSDGDTHGSFWSFTVAGNHVTVPKQAGRLLFFAAFWFIGARVSDHYVSKILRDEKTYVLSQQGATWKIKQLIGQDREDDAIKFVQKHYKMSRSEAEMMVKKIRFGIDATRAATEDTGIDPEEQTATNITPLNRERKKIILDPEVAEQAMQMLREGKSYEALHYIRQENEFDLETAKRVIEKLKKIA